MIFSTQTTIIPCQDFYCRSCYHFSYQLVQYEPRISSRITLSKNTLESPQTAPWHLASKSITARVSSKNWLGLHEYISALTYKASASCVSFLIGISRIQEPLNSYILALSIVRKHYWHLEHNFRTVALAFGASPVNLVAQLASKYLFPKSSYSNLTSRQQVNPEYSITPTLLNDP